MKENKIQLKKVLISKYSLGKDLIISTRDFDSNADPRSVIGYEVLNGDYKGSLFVEQGYPPYYTFISKRPVKYQRANGVFSGELDISSQWFDKVFSGDVRVRTFDTLISLQYMADAVHNFALSINEDDVNKDRVPSFRGYIEDHAKNFPSVAMSNGGLVNGFVPFASAVAKNAKDDITNELTIRGYIMNTERIQNYIQKFKGEIKSSVLEARDERTGAPE